MINQKLDAAVQKFNPWSHATNHNILQFAIEALS